MSTLQILLLVVLVLASASTAGLAWALHLLSHDPLTGLWTRAVLLGSAVGRRLVLVTPAHPNISIPIPGARHPERTHDDRPACPAR